MHPVVRLLLLLVAWSWWGAVGTAASTAGVAGAPTVAPVGGDAQDLCIEREGDERGSGVQPSSSRRRALALVLPVEGLRRKLSAAVACTAVAVRVPQQNHEHPVAHQRAPPVG